MSNQWRTVYKSPNKHVMIRPHNRAQPRSYRSKPATSKFVPPADPPDPLRFVGAVALLVTGIVVVAEGWPFILIGLFIYGIARALK
jgi:hypothetical protein